MFSVLAIHSSHPSMNLTFKRVSKGKQRLSYKGQRRKKKLPFTSIYYTLDTLNTSKQSTGEKMVAQIRKWLMVHGDF